MNAIPSNCRFCNPPDLDRILFSCRHHYVMVSLGQILEGYLLIISKPHIDCCGELSGEAAEEFDWLVGQVEQILISKYGNCLCYEHGRLGSCNAEAGSSIHCHHAHMHFLPLNCGLNAMVGNDFAELNVSSWREFRQTAHQLNNEYLFVKDVKMTLFKPGKTIRSQYLRYKVSEALGAAYLADWVAFPCWDEIRKTCAELSPVFAKLKSPFDV